jgi:hypothetical protein
MSEARKPLTTVLHVNDNVCSTRRQDQSNNADTPTATPTAMPSTVNLPTAHGTVIHSDSETSDEPQAAYHGENEHEDNVLQADTAKRPGDWGYGLSASRARSTTVSQQPGQMEKVHSQQAETLHPDGHQQGPSPLTLATTGPVHNPGQPATGPPPTATAPASNPVQTADQPVPATRPMAERMPRMAGPQEPASRHTMTRPATPPPAIDVEVQAYLNQPVDRPESPPPSPESPPPTHMDALTSWTLRMMESWITDTYQHRHHEDRTTTLALSHLVSKTYLQQ